jgi:hypothetical protein
MIRQIILNVTRVTRHKMKYKSHIQHCHFKNVSQVLIELLQKIIIFSKNTSKTRNTFIIHVWKDDTENKLPLLSF